jgi:DNA-binding response OmpR family regulator
MRKVLIVDDDPTIAALVRELLTEEGFLSVVASDIDSAWAMLLAEDPDAAIVDLWLYGHEVGWELVSRIRFNEHFQTLPVVILTGSATREVAEKAKTLGAECVAKPFTPAALMDRLRKAVSSSGRGPGTIGHPVVLLTRGFRIEGTVHVSDELSRFSDAWEAVVRDPRAYLPLTGATIRSLEGGETIAQHDLIEIRKGDITAVFSNEAP